MDITETFHAPTRAEWRHWLERHHKTKGEIWLIGYLKRTGRASVPYSEAVEEALCFGWIDSIRKTLNDDAFVQRYTPRNPASGYSQINKERLARLIEKGMVLPEVLEAVGDLALDAFEFPHDIITALKEGGAWPFFESTSPAYQRIRVAYVDAARSRPDLFERRLSNLVEKSARKKHFGYGIEDFY